METATVEAQPAPGIASSTVADLLPLAARENGPRTAVLYKEDDSTGWVSKTYSEVGEIVEGLSLGLVALGIEKGDKVAILANTRPEWTYFDFAALTAGATVVPIYQTNSPEECHYVLEHSDAKAVIVEDDEQLEKIRKVRGRCPALEHVIRMTGSSDDAISRQELVERGSARDSADWEERYLPLAHSFALLIQFGTVALGATIAYWERDPLKIIPNLAEVKPTYFPSVPRIFEKIYTAATANAEKAGGLRKAIFNWAIRVGHKVRELERQGKEPGFLLRRQYKVADEQVLSKIRALFGGRLKLAVSGAAPINPEILRFFDAAGVLVVEGWGMTETSTAATIATSEDFKFGTVGKPFPGCEVRIADDGEILVRGPNVFKGYYKNEEATRETLVDGWLRTGDIGEIDDEGYIKITGRKKDIIITAGGKNITPANIEAEVKQHPLVSQCVVIGDRRPYLVALVTLDPEEAVTYAKEHGLPEDPEKLAANEQVRAAIQKHIDGINEKFARVEQVKKFAILPRDLSQESGELTPTMKVKRNVVADKYAGEVDSLYS